MIQRIQTVYLLLATIMVSLTFFWPFAEFSDGSVLKFNGFFETGTDNVLILATWPLATLVISIVVVLVVTIFLFKRRLLQIRLCVFSMVLMAGTVGLAYFYVRSVKSEELIASYNVSLVFPLIGIVLSWLAMRAIAKDLALIRSVDRIR